MAKPRRKPLPYAASGLVDEAIMCQSDALRAIRPVVEQDGMSREHILMAIGQVIFHISQAQARLREIAGRNQG